MKLRDLRIQAGLSQPAIADWLKVTVPQISNYENNISLPVLEDMVILEKKFDQRIDWKDDMTPKRKHETIQALIELCEHYPIPTAVEFANRMFRRENSADGIIICYAKALESQEPLYPPEV
jgi:transcriptional regulator with XRE-family HTH domain